jgi:hypothetical protein
LTLDTETVCISKTSGKLSAAAWRKLPRGKITSAFNPRKSLKLLLLPPSLLSSTDSCLSRAYMKSYSSVTLDQKLISVKKCSAMWVVSVASASPTTIGLYYGSVVGWGAMVQAGRSRVRVPMR